ncbi:MAG: NADPH-dependent FMN reductase [Gaiellaceae bacterium]
MTRVLGISGSLREASYNRALLRAAQELAPPGMEIELYDVGHLPFYDGDVEAAGAPESVEGFRDSIREADALLVATPEYNRGTSGVLKNAIDWASRPPRQSVLDGKPVALMGATTGISGTANAQRQVRESLLFPGAQTLPDELLVARAQERFDEQLKLTDLRTRAELAHLLASLEAWLVQVREALAAAA